MPNRERKSISQEIIFQKYVKQKQSLNDLANQYKRSKRWVYTQISEDETSYKEHHPREIHLVCDTTSYGKRKDKLGTLVFQDYTSKEILLWKYIVGERLKDYKYLHNELIDLMSNLTSPQQHNPKCHQSTNHNLPSKP